MPNPNVSELRLRGWYGEDSDKAQLTHIYSSITDSADQVEHKFIENVDKLGGQYVELAHYSEVMQMIVQNMGNTDGVVFYVDSYTGSIILEYVGSGEHISFCVPDVATGIMLYAANNDELTKWHLAFMGAK